MSGLRSGASLMLFTLLTLAPPARAQEFGTGIRLDPGTLATAPNLAGDGARIAADQNGTVVAAWYGSTGAFYVRSTDHGQTWTAAAPVWQVYAPSLLAYGNGVWLTALESSGFIRVSRSSDGSGWSAPMALRLLIARPPS